jgi:hypothetical protein
MTEANTKTADTVDPDVLRLREKIIALKCEAMRLHAFADKGILGAKDRWKIDGTYEQIAQLIRVLVRLRIEADREIHAGEIKS